MIEFKIKRVYNGADETLGLLFHESPFLVTLELPWKSNIRDISCIPTGTYQADRIVSPHFGDVFQITVPGRSNVLIHWGNFVKDTEGCIILGRAFRDLNQDGTMDVESSKDAFAEFMTRIRLEQSILLTIE